MSAPQREPVSNEQLQATLLVVARREHSLLSLMELSQELSLGLNPHSIADLVLFNLMGQMGAPRAALWLFTDENGDMPVPLRSQGLRRESAKTIGTVLGARRIQDLLNSREPILFADVMEALRPGDRKLIEAAKLKLLAPIHVRGKLTGMVALGGRVSAEPYSAIDKQVIQSSLGILGVTLQNAKLYNRLLEKHRQLKRANERLRELDDMKSQFLSNVSHELRTPLTIMIAYAEILREQLDGQDQKGEFVDTILCEGERLLGLMEKLIDFSELTADHLKIEPKAEDLVGFVAAYCKDRLPGVAESLRELTLHPAEGLAPASFDSERLTQVLDAIVDNAMKFTPPGTRIQIRLACDRDGDAERARIDIEDDGPGIAKDRLACLFDSFRQVDGSLCRKVGGMGIGLSMAKELTERMGGTLTASSLPGKGSVFSVLLPFG